MNPKRLAELEVLYRNALLKDVIPFWINHSLDEKFGGYFTCLNERGEIFETDKYVWLQCRQVWTFSMLYNRVEKRPQWLDVARLGVEFLKKHGMDSNGNWYFSLDREGNPLVQPYNIFSDCFAAMGFSQYALASGDDEARTIAEKTYKKILHRKKNPKGAYSKIVPRTRPMKDFALPMILCNLGQELRWQLPRGDLDRTIDTCIDEVMNQFRDKERGIIYENLRADGSRLDSMDGRQTNPGHGIEAMWFIMDIGRQRGEPALVEEALNTMLKIIEFGWDSEYEGIFYFLDAEGKPPRQLEWDQKLWWVHVEALVGLAMGYALTKREECLRWYERVHEYTWNHFPDPEYGEWWGYLNRRGEVSLSLKGGKWKGCYHVPRALYLCWREFEGLRRAVAP